MIPFFVAIIWVYNLIWFIPLDYIKFVLQAVFQRSVHAVQPFERIHRRLLAWRKAKGAVTPSDLVDKIIEERREQQRQISQTQQEKPLEAKQGSYMSTKLEQVAVAGSSHYAPYTETLSVLLRQNPLTRSFSVT